MNRPINYIGSVGESFTNGFYKNNIESPQRVSVYNQATSGKYSTSHTFNVYPARNKYTNHDRTIRDFGTFKNNVESNNNFIMYGLDLETFGDPFADENSLEFKSSMFSEFTISKRNMVYNPTTSSFNASNSENILNLTFGIDNEQFEALQAIVDKVENKMNLSSTELASLANLQRYGGEDLTKTRGRGKYFSFKDGLYSINEHYEVTDKYDLVSARQGLKNMEFIGSNQHFNSPSGSKKGNSLLGMIYQTINNVRNTNMPMMTYNGISFDERFGNAIFNKYGIQANGQQMNMFDNMLHLDLYEGYKTILGYDAIDTMLGISKNSGGNMPMERLLTLESQASIRGIDANGQFHFAYADIDSMFKNAFEGGIISEIFNEIETVNKSKIALPTFDKHKVLKSNNAIRIGDPASKYNTIKFGVLDQYIEDGKVLHNYAVSVNRGQYYQIGDFGFIPSSELHESARGKLGKGSKGLWYMKLNNMAESVNKSALIFREELTDFNELFQANFNVYDYESKGTYDEYNKAFGVVTQDEINQRTKQLELDGIRNVEGKIKNPKDYYNIKRLRKDMALYDYVQTKLQDPLNQSSSVETLLDINEIMDNEDYQALGMRKKDIESFIQRYDRVSDEYEYNKVALRHIESTVNQETLGLKDSIGRNKNIIEAKQTELYNQMMEDLENRYINAVEPNIENDMKREKLSSSFYGRKSAQVIESDLSKIDILNSTKESIIKANDELNLNSISSNKKYTTVDGGNVEALSDSIRRNARKTTRGKHLTKNESINLQKKYLQDMVDDLVARGVLPKESANKIISNDIGLITNQIASDLNNVVKMASDVLTTNEMFDLSNIKSNKAVKNPLEKSYAGLRMTSHSTIDMSGRKVDGMGFSHFANAFLGSQDASLDYYLKNISQQYYQNMPKDFVTRNKKDFEKSGITTWLKNLGYSDANIETFTDALFTTNNPKNPALGSKESNLQFHFYEKDINGIKTPMLSIAKGDASVAHGVQKGEYLNNTVDIMLPRIINPRGDGVVSDVVDIDTPNRFVQIGDSMKHIAKEYVTYPKNGNLVLEQRDLIDNILNVFKMKKSQIADLIENGEYDKASSVINSYTKRLQLDTSGVSPEVTVYTPSGGLTKEFQPRLVDFDRASRINGDDLGKYLPFIYEYYEANHNEIDSKNPMHQLINQLEEDFSKEYEPGYIRNQMYKMKENIMTDRNYDFTNAPGAIQEWLRRYTYVDQGVDSNHGLFMKAVMEYANVTKDEKGLKILDALGQTEYHSITKDSDGKHFYIETGLNAKGNVGSHQTSSARPTNPQMRGAIPLNYKELEYGFVQDKIAKSLGVTQGLNTIKSNTTPGNPRDYIVESFKNIGVDITSPLTTDSLIESYAERKRYGYDVIENISGNLLQANPSKYLKTFNNIKSNSPFATTLLDQINARTGGSYTLEQLQEASEMLNTNFATYEQGGLLNPRLMPMFDKPQLFSEQVGKEVYEEILGKLGRGEEVKLTEGTQLGYIDDKSAMKTFRGQSGIVTGVAPQRSVNEKYTIHYRHENPNLENTVKFFIGGGEKGVFGIPLDGVNDDLIMELYDEIFGRDVAAVTSFDNFKHKNFGMIANSDIRTMYQGYKQAGQDYVDAFLGKLQNLLPQYGYEEVIHPATNQVVLMHKASPKMFEDKTMYSAIDTLRTDLKASMDEVDKKILNTIESNEARGILNTDFHVAPLEEGMGGSVKSEKRLEGYSDHINDIQVDEATRLKQEESSNVIKSHLTTKLESSDQYREGQRLNQNMRTTYSILDGNDMGVIDEITIDDIKVPTHMASREEIAESIIFDYDRRVGNGVAVNSYSIEIPGGGAIKNPLNGEEKINRLIIPATKPYKQEKYMMSNMQKNISSLIVDMKEMQYSIDNGDMEQYFERLDRLNSRYDTFIASFYNEFTDKDGLVEDRLKSIRLDEGGFSINKKVVEPIFTGSFEEGQELGHYLDPNASKFTLELNGKMVYGDVFEASESSLQDLGIYIDEVGEELFNSQDKYKGFFAKYSEDYLRDIDVANKNLALAQDKLKSNLTKTDMEQVRLDVKQYTKQLKGYYRQMGEFYLENEGMYTFAGRYPFAKDQSALPMKVYYNKRMKGKSIMMNPITAEKLKLDTDGDALAKLLSSLRGRVGLLGENNPLEVALKNVFEFNATYRNDKIARKLAQSRSGELEGAKYIVEGKTNKPFYQAYRDYSKDKYDGAPDITDFDNEFYDPKSRDAALKSISAKASIGQVSNQNLKLKELIALTNPGSIENRFIREFVDGMEQGIFNTKHSSEEIYEMLKARPYAKSIEKMASGREDSMKEGINEFSNIITKLGIYGDTIIETDKITDSLGVKISDMDVELNDAERLVKIVSEMYSSEEARDIYKDPLFFRQSYSDSKKKEVVKQIYDANGETKYGGRLGRSHGLFGGLDDFEYVTLGEEKLGIGSFIQKEGYEPYKITDILKLEKGLDAVELENLYGERYHVLGSTFNEISEILSKEGFSFLDSETLIDDIDFLDEMFKSKDSYLKQMVYNEVMPFLDEDNVANNRELNKRLMKVSDALNLSKEAVEISKESLLLDASLGYANKYKDFQDIYSASQDVFREINDVIGMLEQTKQFDEQEIMTHARSFYDDTVAKLSADMNNNIRRQAIYEGKRSLYERVLDPNSYLDLDEYMGMYDTMKGEHKVNYNNRLVQKPTGYADYFNMDIGKGFSASTFEELNELGNITITKGKQSNKVNEMSNEEILKFINSSSPGATEEYLEAQERAKHYLLNKYELTRVYGEPMDRSTNMVDTISQTMNDSARESAKKLKTEAVQGLSSNSLKGSMEYIKNHKFIAAAMAIGAIGLVSTVSNSSITKPLEVDKKPNGESPSPDGSYSSSKKPRVAPRSDNKVYLSHNDGMTYNISARNTGRSNDQNAIAKLKGLVTPNSNINVTQRQDNSTVSDSWLEEKIGGLF